MNYLFLLLFFELVLFFMAYVLSENDIMAPSVMMTIMFLISTIFAISNITTWNIDYSFTSTMIISSGIFVFIIAELLFRHFFCQKKNSCVQTQTNDFYSYSVSNWMILSLIIFNIAVSYWYFVSIRRAVGGGSGLANIFVSYRRLGVSNLANSESESINIILNQLLKIVKASGFISAYLYINDFFMGRKKFLKSISLILVIISSLLPAIMIASRAEMLKFVSAILIEIYILWNQKKGWRKKVFWKFIKIGLLCLFIGIPGFYYLANLLGRGSTQLGIIDYAAEYIGSSICMFDLYIKDPIASGSFGEETLVGVRKVLGALGIQSASSSSNLEFRHLGMGVSRSNVYTFFRRPLHDYGFIGMYIFTIVIAFLFAWIYYGKIKGEKRTRKVDKWVLVYGYLYYWMVSSSILQYSSSYISMGTVMILTIILLGFDIMTKVKIK